MDLNAQDEGEGYLTGQLLIAMPSMADSRFAKTVIYICSHSSDGAMGIVINRAMPAITPDELLQQLGIEDAGDPDQLRIQFGGPVEGGRGFVLHSADFQREGTLMVDERLNGGVALTATLDILKAIARGTGPQHHLLALGYAGWGPGQLEAELQDNGWLAVPADSDLLFDGDLSTKWERAIAKLGFNPDRLSTDSGHA
jgi:putative transcriptional regulator